MLAEIRASIPISMPDMGTGKPGSGENIVPDREPLIDEVEFGAFQRVMHILHPEKHYSDDDEEKNRKIQASSYWVRAVLTVEDLADSNLDLLLLRKWGEMQQATYRGENLPSLSLPNGDTLHDVSPTMLTQLSYDVSFLRNRLFNRSQPDEALYPSIPVLAEREKGEVFGLEVRKHYVGMREEETREREKQVQHILETVRQRRKRKQLSGE